MPPITWRNVEAPSFRDAILAGAQAQQSFNSGFDSLNKLVDQETKTNIANWDNTKNNNTQEFLNQLNQYRTPEELQAAQASGALDALRQRYGPQVDQAAIRTAEDGRLSTLQQRSLTGIDFKNKSLENELRPQIQQATALAAAGDKKGLESLFANNPTLRDFMGGKLTAEAIVGERAADVHKWAGNDDTRKQTKLDDDLLTNAAHRSLYRAQANHLADGGDGTGNGKQPKGAVRANETGLGYTLLSGGYLGTKDGDKAFSDGLKALGIEGKDAEKAWSKFTNWSRDRNYEKVPVTLALQNLAGAKDTSGWLGSNNRIDNALQRFTEDYGKDSVQQELGIGRQFVANLVQPAIGKGSAPAVLVPDGSPAPAPSAPVVVVPPPTQPESTYFGRRPPPNLPRPTLNPLNVGEDGAKVVNRVIDVRNRQAPSIYSR